MILNRSNFTKYYTINLATYITFTILLFFYLPRVISHKLKRSNNTDVVAYTSMRQDCIHFDDKMV